VDLWGLNFISFLWHCLLFYFWYAGHILHYFVCGLMFFTWMPLVSAILQKDRRDMLYGSYTGDVKNLKHSPLQWVLNWFLQNTSKCFHVADGTEKRSSWINRASWKPLSTKHYFHAQLPWTPLLTSLLTILQGGSNMTETDLCANKTRCAAAMRPWESEAKTSTLPPVRVRTCSVLSGSC